MKTLPADKRTAPRLFVPVATLAVLQIWFGPASHGQDVLSPSLGDDSAERVVVTSSVPAPVSKTDLSDDPLASPSSVAVVTNDAIKQQTIQSYGDIFRPVAGVTVSNYDQGNLSYGLALRGFDDGNHGGDIAYKIDGVPVNLPSSNVGTNGYDILSPLIPEAVQSLAIYRGPFNVRFGDFALGGAVDIHTLDQAPTLLETTAGSFDAFRELGVFGFKLGPNLTGYTALEADTQTGYRDNSNERTINSFTHLDAPIFNGGGTVGFRGQIYSTSYGAPGYLDRTLVENSTLSPTDSINVNDGGSLTQLSFSTPVYITSPQGNFFATLFVNRSLLKRWSDFDVEPVPASTPDRLQIDDRWTAGGTVEKNFNFDQYGNAVRLPTEITVGVESRSDFVSQGVYSAVHRTPVSTSSLYDFTQQNAGAYVNLQLKPFPWLKVVGGTRYDRFFYNISAEIGGQRIDHNTGAFSPKAGAAVTPVRGVSIFANYGESLRSPSAVDDLPGNPDLQPAKMRSVEAGITYDTSPGLAAAVPSETKDAKGGGSPDAAPPMAAAGTVHFLAAVYYTTLSNEVINGPDGSTPENLGLSRRKGLEVEASYVAYHREVIGFSVFANYAYVDALLLNGPVHQFVPDVNRFHVNYGFDLQTPWLFNPGSPHRFDLSVYHEIIGPEHLTSDGLSYTHTYTRLSAKLTYANTHLPKLNAFVGLTAYPDRRSEETAFDFGPAANGTEIIGVSPKPLVDLQGGLLYAF